MGDSRAPTVAALTRSLTCPFCSTTARGSTCRKLQWSRSCCAFFWWPTSLLCRSCWCRFLRLWTPCDHAEPSFLFNSRGAQIRSSPEFMDILLCDREGHSTSAVLVMTAMQWFLAHFAPFYRAPRSSRIFELWNFVCEKFSSFQRRFNTAQQLHVRHSGSRRFQFQGWTQCGLLAQPTCTRRPRSLGASQSSPRSPGKSTTQGRVFCLVCDLGIHRTR